MATTADSEAGANLQEWNEDFDALIYRPTGSAQGRVLNTANEPPTIYAVDIDEISCTCEHGQRGPADGRSCKHLAKAMLAHPDYNDSAEFLVRDLSVVVDRAAQAARELEETRDLAQTKVNADAAHAAAQDGSEESEDIDPVDALEAKLDALGLDSDDFDIWVDDDLGSLQFEQDGYLDDDEYSTLMDWVTDDDVAVNWDSDAERNYIKQDDFAEVVR